MQGPELVARTETLVQVSTMHRRLTAEAYTDPLTCLSNRRRFNDLVAAADKLVREDRRVGGAGALLARDGEHRLGAVAPGVRRAACVVEIDHHTGTDRFGDIVMPPDDLVLAERLAREAGLEQARLRRLARHRAARDDTTTQGPDDVV